MVELTRALLDRGSSDADVGLCFVCGAMREGEISRTILQLCFR